MATLDDVQRQLVDVDAGSARHKESVAEIEPGPFSPFPQWVAELACAASALEPPPPGLLPTLIGPDAPLTDP